MSAVKVRNSKSGKQKYSPKQVIQFRRLILPWFRKHGRDFPWRSASASQYQRILSEVLLQRTRAETVAPFFRKFVTRFPSWNKLNKATEHDLRKYLRPVGLWQRRAASLKCLAREMVKRRGRFPRDREDIESLPGVGQYIASAVLLFCYGLQEPLIDVNMARVLERVFGPRKLADIRYDPYLQRLARNIVRCETPAELNWATFDLAATICLPRKPRCSDCPLVSMCRNAASRWIAA